MPKRNTIIPYSAIARIMINSGAKRISDSGVKAMTDIATEISMNISKRAAEICKHAGRKTILDSDIKLAAKK